MWPSKHARLNPVDFSGRLERQSPQRLTAGCHQSQRYGFGRREAGEAVAQLCFDLIDARGPSR